MCVDDDFTAPQIVSGDGESPGALAGERKPARRVGEARRTDDAAGRRCPHLWSFLKKSLKN
jgi:hypothetical protein